MTYKNKTLRRAAAAAAAICLAFAFAFAEETGADRLGFGTSITVSAADNVTIGNATVTYTKGTDNNVTITKVEAGNETSIVIPDKLDGGTVTAIGYNAFTDCETLESITLPQNITSIGSSAFKNCAALKSINIPDNVTKIKDYTFYECQSLTNITIPSKVESIEGSSFRNCTALTSINIPDSVESIGLGAFAGCTSLKSIELPDNLESIRNSAFLDCNSLESVVIPAGVTSVGDQTFAGCTALTSIVIPYSVTNIGADTFLDCTSLKAVFAKEGLYLGSASIPAGTAKITYKKDSNNNVTITNVDAGNQTSIVIPETLDGGKVRTIGANAFDGCSSLTSITLPQSLTSIEDLAFADCTALQNINIPQNVTNIGVSAFLQCKSLTSITIPSGVTSIKTATFANCTSLKSIELPDHLVSIGISAFGNCTSLESVVIPAEVTSVGQFAFSGCISLESVVIPMSVTSVGNGAFDSCISLKAVFAKEGLPLESASIPSGAVKIYYQVEDLGYVSILKARAGTQAGIECIEIPRTIGGLDVRVIKEEAFRDCGNIKKIILPDSIREIQNSAFSYCTSLESINIPAGVTSIGNYAFDSCTSLESINIPVGITSIGDYAFEDCTALKSVVIPQSVTNIGYAAFSRCDKLVSIDIPMGVSMISNNTFENCTSLTAINIPTSVRQIGDESFMGCTALTSIIVPEGVTTIGKRVFHHCTALESVSLPDSLTEIKGNAFQDCPALKSINIPKGVTSIEAFVFSDCQALADVTLPEGIQWINMCAFENCSSLETIALPSSTKNIKQDAFENCTSLKTIFLPQNAVQETASIPDTSAKIKYEIRGNFAYILEITPDSSNAPVVIPDTIRGYEVKYVEEEYRQYVSETGHTHKGGTATCTEKALCDICGNSYDSTDSTNHDADTSVWKYDENGHWNPCLRTGCEEHLNAAAHTFDSGVITTEPTEKTEGVRTYTCEICGYEKTESVPKLGHIPSAKWSYDSENHWKECTAEDCDEKLELAAHTFDDGVITVKPADTADGTKTYTCTVCGYEKTESVPKLGHIPSAKWSYDSENHWKECTAEDCNEKLELAAHTFDNGVITAEPTETTDGVRTYTCTVCGYEKTESIEKLPPKPAAVIYPIKISGDVTADRSSAAAGETVNVSAPFGYDIIVADINGRQIAKFSEKGSFEMPSSRVSITAVRGEIFTHMSNAWSHSYVYSYDSDMNRIKVNSDTRRGVITIDLGADHAGRSFTVYSGRKSTSKKIISGTLDENGRYTFRSEEGKNYTLVIE
ncbi:leucine-rich repeat domain-containing protein [Huintestinicola sp.]